MLTIPYSFRVNWMCSLLALAWVGVSTIKADTLVDFDLDKIPPGPFSQFGESGQGQVTAWRGPDSAFGRFQVTVDRDERSLEFLDSGAEREKSPTLNIRWPAVEVTRSAQVSIEFAYLIPVSGAYRADVLVGGTWATAACNLVLENGQIRAHDGKAAENLAEYEVGVWQILRIDLDLKQRTYSVMLDGKPLARGFPWPDATKESVAGFQILADQTAIDRADATVLKIRNLAVSKK